MCSSTADCKKVESEELSVPPNVYVSSHPVLAHKITILRSSTTIPSSFRSVLREVTYHLGYEATSDLTTRPIQISVPNGKELIEHTGAKLKERVAMIPIMRSGLGMVDSMLELLPNAGIHHIGMYKKGGSVPVQYYNRIPRKCEADVAYILDPMIATAITTMSVIGILKKWGVAKIHVISVIASITGLQAMAKNHPDIKVTIGAVDDTLTEGGVVLPGLGDAGDRLFGTPVMDDDEALLHPSKRKRSDAGL